MNEIQKRRANMGLLIVWVAIITASIVVNIADHDPGEAIYYVLGLLAGLLVSYYFRKVW